MQVGQTLYLSGCLGLDPSTGQFSGDGVQEQARQVDHHNHIRLLLNYVLVIEKSGRSSQGSGCDVQKWYVERGKAEAEHCIALPFQWSKRTSFLWI